MTEGTAQKPGGKYNGCTITGVGREKATAILYRTLTANLTSTANFKAVYTAALRSCTELYPNDTATCNEVKKSFQATEMDQQPDGQAYGAKCIGKTEAPATCADQTQEPSTTLIPAEPTNPPTSGTSPTRTPTISTVVSPTTPPASGSPTVSPVPTTSVTPSPVAGQTNFTLKVKFQGIGSIATNQSVKLSIRLINDEGDEYKATGTVTGTAGQAIWSGGFTTDAPAGDGYTFLVKGERHVQKKVCVDTPTEQYPGSYRCTKGTITLKKDGVYDFSGITLLVGDLPEQDGIVNAYDIGLIINNFGKRDSDILSKADVNMDGIVDTQDYSLVIAALSIRYDEE